MKTRCTSARFHLKRKQDQTLTLGIFSKARRKWFAYFDLAPVFEWDEISVSREFRFTVEEYSTASDLERGWEKSPPRLLDQRKKYR